MDLYGQTKHEIFPLVSYKTYAHSLIEIEDVFDLCCSEDSNPCLENELTD